MTHCCWQEEIKTVKLYCLMNCKLLIWGEIKILCKFERILNDFYVYSRHNFSSNRTLIDSYVYMDDSDVN